MASISTEQRINTPNENANIKGTTTSTTYTPNVDTNGGVGGMGGMGSGEDYTKYFTSANAYNISLCLFVFLIFYFILRMFIGGGGGSSTSSVASAAAATSTTLSHILDICVLIFVAFVWIIPLLFYSSSQRDEVLSNNLTNFESFISTPSSFVVILLILITIYIFSLLFSTMSVSKPYTMMFAENILWILLIFIVIANFFTHILHVDFVHWLNTVLGINKDVAVLTTGAPSTTPSASSASNVSANLTSPPPPSTPVNDGENEVFNVGNNLYTYDDATAICKSYGATVATYDQVEDAYNQGGEWCNYGWSAGQMALFPTQKATWSSLQNDPATKNNCGRPGVNGGYISNPYVKFGVNCYGKKPPKPAGTGNKNSTANKMKVIPKTKEEQMLQNKVDFWKENGDKILQINYFNDKQWNEPSSSSVKINSDAAVTNGNTVVPLTPK